MTRALLENTLAPASLDALFSEHSEWQYERKLLFSSVVDLMGMVVCRLEPSIHTAYKAVKDTLPDRRHPPGVHPGRLVDDLVDPGPLIFA